VVYGGRLENDCVISTVGSNPTSSVAVVGSTNEDPVGHFVNENHLVSQSHGITSIGAVVAQSLDMGEVTGSNPVSTIADVAQW
jgi:phosphohistidine swiveling domain-containing protein